MQHPPGPRRASRAQALRTGPQVRDPASLLSSAGAPARRGHLVIIGGGPRPEAVMRRTVELAGGPAARIAIIPAASEVPREIGPEQKRQFEAAGAGHVDVIYCDPSDADRPENLARLARATGVFFSGGDQRKLAATLHGTRLLRAVRRVHARGGVVAGTSAGAAVMSRLMITGDERGPASALRDVHTGQGFGFLDSVIIDQHFVKRRRHDRLHRLVLRHPHLLGVGIDEETAIVVRPDGTFETLGESTVLVFNAARGRALPGRGPVEIDVLSSGHRYCLNEQRVLG